MSTWLCPGLACTNLVTGHDLCTDCVAYLPTLIDELGSLWLKARRLLHPVRQRTDQPISTSKPGSQPPLNVMILDLVGTTFAQITGWAATIRIRESMEAADAEEMAVAYHNARSLLATRYETLIGSSLLVDFYNSIFGLHRDLTRVAGDAQEFKRLHDPCFTCGMLTLMRHDDHVVCLTCSARLGQSAYTALSRSVRNRTTEHSLDRSNEQPQQIPIKEYSQP